MKTIAITQRTQFIEEHQETRDALDQRWHDLLVLCNIVPLIIPNHLETANNIIDHTPISGIVLTGGNDSPSRMLTETMLLEFAIRKKLPVLGVCHGMQVIQQYFGLKLHNITGHITEKQEIFLQDKTYAVNSYHSLGTTETTSDLIVWAKAHDGIVKAIKHKELPLMGIMWHPERHNPFHEFDIMLMKNFFSDQYRSTGEKNENHMGLYKIS